MDTAESNTIDLLSALATQLVADGPVEVATMGARTMKEWVSIAADADPEVTLDQWTMLAREALRYVRGQAARG